ncbi:MAG: mechanosensitive ion channel domain-containing protein [Rhodanobacteraceae bacterium]
MAGAITQKIDQAGNGAQHGIAAVWEEVTDVLGFRLIHASGVEITVGGVLTGLLVLLALWFVTRVVRRSFVRYQSRHKNASRAAIYTVSRITHYLLLVIGVLIALSVAGIPMSKFELFAGALGVGLGFGLQAIFNNFVSGLIILFERSLKVGDFVELASGVHGEVRDIQIRSTRVTTNDNIDILVPNSEFVNKQVVNWTLREVSRRLHVPFGVAYGADKEVVKKAGLEAAAEVPFTLAQDGKRKPQVWLTGFGDSALNFELVVWLTADATKRPAGVTAAYNWALHTALQKYDIEIPFPQRDLNVRSWFGLEGEDAVGAVVSGEMPGGKKPRDSGIDAGAKPKPADASHSQNDAALEVQRDIEEEAEREAERQRKQSLEHHDKSDLDETAVRGHRDAARADKNKDD